MNANTFFNNAAGIVRQPYHFNQFGGNLGGPAVKNKLFFFFYNYDAQRNTSPNAVFFPAIALPTDAASQAGVRELGKYFVPYVTGLRNDIHTAKVDWAVNANHTLSVRYNNHRFLGTNFENPGAQSALERTGDSVINTDSVTVSHTWILGANKVLDQRFLFYNEDNPSTVNGPGPEVVVRQSGVIFMQFGRGNFLPRFVKQKKVSGIQTLSWNKGRHSFKFVHDFRFERAHQFNTTLFYDQYTFDSLADFANRRPSAFAQTLTASGTPGGNVFPNGDDYAFFAQDAWQFDTRWSVTVGARYERWRASEGARTVDSAGVRRRTALPGREQDRVSPKLALAWRPVKDWTARLSLARTSRFPTVGELYQGITLADGTVTNNNPTLRAESSFSKDLTFERALPQGVLRASLFEEDTKDTLFTQTNTTTLVTNFQNIPKVLTRGAEMAFDQKGFLIDAVDLQAGLTYTDSEIRSNPAFPASEGKQFPRISHWRASLFATYHATAALSLTAGWRYASGQFSTLDNIDTRATYGGVSGYSLVDLRAAYTLSRGFTVALGVDNVTRYKYYQGHNLLQRTYFAEIKARF